MVESSPDFLLYEVTGDKNTSKEALTYSAISTVSMNTENIYAGVSEMNSNEFPPTEKAEKVKRGSKQIVPLLAIFALVAALVIIMASILALFVNIAELRAATDSLQQQQDEKLNSSIEMTYKKLTEEYTAAFTLLNNSVESMNHHTFNTTQELNNLIQELSRGITSYGNKTDQLVINLLTQIHPTTCVALPPSSPSGYYSGRASDGSMVRVYCDMTRSCGGVTGGWMRVAELDMRNSSHQCPSGLRQCYQSGYSLRTCCITSDSPACSSVIFHVPSLYSKVCGKIRGYQLGSPSTFSDNGQVYNRTIEGNYVDGVSLTHGHPRQHIWTFAAGQDEVATQPNANCPCTNIHQAINASQPPAYVGDDYFCDTGSSGRHESGHLYSSNPLWDGAGCGPLNTCCSFNHPPWFYKQLPQPTTDDIEVRVCRGQPSSLDEILIEEIEIYIQ